MGTGKRKNMEQIPMEDAPQGKTGKVVSEQRAGFLQFSF
jgi:hypothetical protein